MALVTVSIFKTIQTKYLPTTNKKPSRVKAWCEAGSLILSWDHGLSTEQMHARVARQLQSKLGWGELKLIGAALPNSKGYIFIQIDPKNRG